MIVSAVLDTIRRAAELGARLVSFCTGTFTLAAAGVLDGCRVTTHWGWPESFTARFPQVRLDFERSPAPTDSVRRRTCAPTCAAVPGSPPPSADAGSP
ncbi:DJ-1/PfpI family protein [Streptomyces sp. NPDC048496]|uniref:DJ-1/PfpI family protein n=1 Tax=Streptomyces sp. NPDC048496 TaxID=3365558 RepID=UPI00371A0D3A